MEFDIFTLFPDMFTSYLQASILQRAIARGLVTVRTHDIRLWAPGKHHVTDEPPYGGGGGMVMKAEPIFNAVEAIFGKPPQYPLILLTPQGRLFNQQVAQELLAYSRIGLLCGHYEGVDERVHEHLVSDEISIGDFVLTGGELPALVIIDAVSRLIPGVLGDPDGAMHDSYAMNLLEYPHYTRPAEFRNWRVPEVLLSGNHAEIARWRREQALKRTWLRRPDLLQTAELSEADRKYLQQLEKEMDKKDRSDHFNEY